MGAGAVGIGVFSQSTSAKSASTELSEFTMVNCLSVTGQNNLVFTALTGSDIILYYAKNASTAEDTADKVIQLTKPSNGSVWNLTQTAETSFQYWQNGSIYTVSITAEGRIGSISSTGKKKRPEELKKDRSLSTNQVEGPGGGGGGTDVPDWWYESEFYKDARTVTKKVEPLGVEFIQVDVNLGETSPRFRTSDCTGVDRPIVGSSLNSIEVSTALGQASIALDIWFGVDPTTGCLYFGSESAGFCLQDCTLPVATATVADVRNTMKTAVEHAVDTVSDQIGNISGIDASDLVAAALGLLAGAILLLCGSAVVSIFGGMVVLGMAGSVGA